MKAAVLTANQTLELKDVPLPELKLDQARIRIRSAGICSSDINRSFGAGAYHYPLIMGHELSGEVSQTLGKSSFKVGDRVSIFPLIPCKKCVPCLKENFAQCKNYDYYGSRRDGGFAEYLDVNHWNLLKIPAEVDFEHAAMLEPIAVVLNALKKGGFLNSSSSELVILGAGFLGLIALRILKLKNPNKKITVLDRNLFKLEVAQKSGAETHHLEKNGDWDSFAEKNKDRFPSVLEAIGTPTTYLTSITLASQGATLVWMGNISGDLNIPKQKVSSILRKELVLQGVWNSCYQQKIGDDWNDAIEMIKDGLDLSDLLSLHISLDALPDTLKKLYLHKEGKLNFPLIKALVKL